MPNWFVGIRVPAGEWLAPLVADAPSGVRVIHPEDVHMTVAFLGRIDEHTARSVFGLADGLTAAPFDVVLGGLRPMGSRRRPTAMSIELEAGKDEAIAIMLALRDEMHAAAGCEPERRDPLPHITVARPPRNAGARERKAAVRWASDKPAVHVTLTLDTLALYTWGENRKVREFRIVDSRLLK